jgi:hypothetical protein
MLPQLLHLLLVLLPLLLPDALVKHCIEFLYACLQVLPGC